MLLWIFGWQEIYGHGQNSKAFWTFFLIFQVLTSAPIFSIFIYIIYIFYFGASFSVYHEKASHFITSNCVTEMMTFICVYMHICMCYISYPFSRFYCAHKSHYRFIEYTMTFYSMFYAFGAITFPFSLSEMTRIKMINQLPIYCAVNQYWIYNSIGQ